MKKIFLIMALATNSVFALYGQTTLPATICKYTTNTSGTTNQVLPSATQLQKTAATSNIIINYLPSIAAFTPLQQIAIDYARSIWEQSITSSVPIHVTISYFALGSTLGTTSTQYVSSTGLTSFSGEPLIQTGVNYPKALANKLTHSELSTATPIAADMTIKISSNPPLPWYYGTDANCPIGNIDFVTTLLHEIGHGLGFSTTVRLNAATPPAPAYGFGLTGTPLVIADKSISDNLGTTLLTSFVSPSTPLTNFCQSNNVCFNGSNATIQNGGTRPKLSSPSPFVNGSSINHWDKITYPVGNANTLLSPSKTNGEAIHNLGDITLGYLEDIGWTVLYDVGIEDRVTITSYPTTLSENQVFTCNGAFIDNSPFGASMSNPSWKIEAYHNGGKVIIKSGTGFSGFTSVNLGTLPVGYEWIREFSSGNVRADIVFYGTDSQGWYHDDKKRIGILYKPAKPVISIVSVDHCTQTVKLSFYAKGATGYTIYYDNVPGVTQIKPLVQIYMPASNTNTATITMLMSSMFYFVAEAYNNIGYSDLSNEVAADVYYCCGSNCYLQRKSNQNNEEDKIDNPIANIVYLNDSKYGVNFTGEYSASKTINVCNILGQNVFTQQVNSDEAQSILDLNALPNGIYVISVLSSNSNLFQQKIVISK
jgi:hypothetical protein